ncbi:MAG: response regulator [Candidatus Rokubacteria bacterium]|nr:response regulator [Candidatus Rokubacteria bacterium]
MKTILIIEDDRVLRRACEASLRRRGFTVLAVGDGEEGLRLARAERPDLVLLDLLMPRMTGVEVLRALRAAEETRDLPVIVLSNSSRPDDVQEVQALGIVDYLVKANLSLQALGDRVERVVGT